MNLYLCKYPIKFPASEYGGLVAVIAKSPKELGKILTGLYGKHNYFDLSIAVESVSYYQLDPSREYEAGLVEAFYT